MIGRAIWIAALAALGVVTALAQIDSRSRFAPELALLVPEPFRGFAQTRLAQQAMVLEQHDQALELARGLVRVRPLPAENLALLSQTALLAGEGDLGLAALEEAGKRGWREPFSQQAMAQAALLSGNAEAASLRIAALLATQALPQTMVQPLLDDLVATPEGRQALAKRLAEEGYWQSGFVQRGPALVTSAAYVDVIARARLLDAPLACNGLDRARQMIRNRGEGDLADRIATQGCVRQS